MSIEAKPNSYDRIGREYYDGAHATCRSFESATQSFLRDNQLILHDINTSGMLLDVGSGKGMASHYLGPITGNLIQLDASSTMLSQAEGAKVRGDALTLPFGDESFDTISAFLYDPFNVEKFRQEIARVLKPGGVFIGTLPSFQWASTFRYSQDFRNTEITNNTFFTLQDGARVEEPSFVQRDVDIEYALWQVGFDRVETFGIPASYVDGRPSHSITSTAWLNDDRKPLDRLDVVTVVKASKLDKSRVGLEKPPTWVREAIMQIISARHYLERES